MIVHFIGAGPGAADLLTLRGRDLIARSPICLYAGSLIPAGVLIHVPAGARVVDTEDMTLDQIVAEIASAQAKGQDVARLHSGDLSMWSAMAEQMRRLDALGIPYDVTPGVPAFAAAAASLRQELTLPELAQTLILTRTATRSTAMPPGEDLASLGRSGATLAIHLSIQNLSRVVATLAPLYGAECPVAVVARASWPDERILRGTLGSIERNVAEARITRTALILVGRALGAADFGESHLYSVARERRSDSSTASKNLSGARPDASIEPGEKRHAPIFDLAFQRGFRDLLVWRRDVRRFRTEPLPPGLLEELLALASLAPSVGLSEPWRFVQVADASRRRAVRQNFEAANQAALAGYDGAQAKLYARLKLSGLDDAPVQIAVFTDVSTGQGHGLGRATMPETAAYSTVAAIHTLWLAACAAGIGVGWVSILDPASIVALLDVPSAWILTAYLCIGYPVAEDDTPVLHRAGWEHRGDLSCKLLRR